VRGKSSLYVIKTVSFIRICAILLLCYVAVIIVCCITLVTLSNDHAYILSLDR